jgi:hypothetical protein
VLDSLSGDAVILSRRFTAEELASVVFDGFRGGHGFGLIPDLLGGTTGTVAPMCFSLSVEACLDRKRRPVWCQ